MRAALLTGEQEIGRNNFVMTRFNHAWVASGLPAMPHRMTASFVCPGRAAACVVAGALLLLLGGFNGRSDAAGAEPMVRHDAARRAIQDLDRLTHLAVRLGEPATEDAWLVLNRDLKQARAALGADMIALRELVRPGDEEATLRAALAAEASYQAAWLEARDQARAAGVEDAARALDAAGPLADRATAALASLGHSLDEGDRAAMLTQATAERAGRFWNAGLALVMAGALLFGLARITGKAAGREGLPG